MGGAGDMNKYKPALALTWAFTKNEVPRAEERRNREDFKKSVTRDALVKLGVDYFSATRLAAAGSGHIRSRFKQCLITLSIPPEGYRE